MSDTIQTITLTSEQHFGRRIPCRAIGEVLRVLPDVIRASIRMAFESRSDATGKRPHWLSAASDIRFLEHSGDDETVLHFSAPRLGDAAEVLYRQQEFWPSKPEPTDTGFDLLGDVVADIASNNTNSVRFDRPLLQRVERFKHGLNGTFQIMSFTCHRFPTNAPAVINTELVQTAAKMFRNTPEPQQTRIVGTLDMIRSSTNAFAIKLQNEEEVRAVLIEGKVSRLTALMEQAVLILGKAVYRPSGKLLRIDADEVLPASQQDSFFSAIPKSKRVKFDLRAAVRDQQHKKGIAAIYGKWPGDESDEQIEAALREIS